MFRELAKQKECEIEEGHLIVDHVHMLISVPPKYSVAQVMGYIKGKSAIHIARVYAGRRRNFVGQHFWARGYWVSTVRAMVVKHGDFRLVAANADVPKTTFAPHPLFSNTGARVAATLSVNNHAAYPSTGSDQSGKYITGAPYDLSVIPIIPSNSTGVNSPQGTGDFDNGISGVIDGPYVNKADEGDKATLASWGALTPYFTIISDDNFFKDVGETFFSPNRQIPSSGMLGSLSTGVKAGVPWKTLLFRPQASHPSYSTTIPDHLLTDLFWMPVVEPYAISEPFSTADKINMNYQIMPFGYIHWTTGMAAILRSEKS